MSARSYVTDANPRVRETRPRILNVDMPLRPRIRSVPISHAPHAFLCAIKYSLFSFGALFFSESRRRHQLRSRRTRSLWLSLEPLHFLFTLKMATAEASAVSRASRAESDKRRCLAT